LIETTETSIKKINNDIISASEEGNGELISELSKKLKEHTLELDRQYEFLITLTDNFDQITHKYEKEISQLEDSRS